MTRKTDIDLEFLRLKYTFVSQPVKSECKVLEPNEYITNISIEVKGIIDDDGTYGKIGQLRLYLVNFEFADLCLNDILDAYASTLEFLDICNINHEGYSKRVLNILRSNEFHKYETEVFIIIDQIEILPPFRGQGITKVIIQDMKRWFGYGIDMYVLKVFPLQFEESKKSNSPAYQNENSWGKAMEYDMLPKNKKVAQSKLFKLYSSLGFVRISKTSMIMIKPIA